MSSRAFKKSWFLLLLLVAILVGGWLVFGRSNIKKLDQPEYLTFAGNYVFSVPKDFAVDEQAIQGIQIVSSTSKGITGKTIDEVYADDNISLQPLDFLKNKKGNDFKNYINNTLVPEQKQKLSQDTTASFTKEDGIDVARVVVKKDGSAFRFIYIKGGQHPVSVVSKQETDPLKKIEQSVTDVEKTDLKSETSKLKGAAQKVAQQIRDKKTADIYNQSAPEFRAKNPQSDLDKLLTSASVYSQGQITINGGSYSNGQFGAVIGFIPISTDFKRSSGAMYFKKISGQWKLMGLQLPAPVKVEKTQ